MKNNGSFSLGVEFQKAIECSDIETIQEENEEQYARPKCTLNSNCWITTLKSYQKRLERNGCDIIFN